MADFSQYFSDYRDNGDFWGKATEFKDKDGNSTSIDNGLVILDSNATSGLGGAASESIGYSLVLSALYNDQATFDRISSVIQTILEASDQDLMPWNITNDGTTWSVADDNSVNYYSSASDADINIALGYAYATFAAKVYGWTDNDSLGNSYETLATKYIQAIRTTDFNPNAGDYQKYLLTDGSDQAKNNSDSWHPDYSDPRAYQLFKYFDSENHDFWNNATSNTLIFWQALLNFGDDDPRTQQAPSSQSINTQEEHTNLTSATYSIKAGETYDSYEATAYGDSYDSDCQRFPLRLLNYIQANDNDNSSDIIGIGSSMLEALGSSFQSQGNQIASSVKTVPPWLNDGGYTQNFTASGLYSLAANGTTSWENKSDVYASLNAKFGENGTGLNTLTANTGSGFNDSLTLWSLTTATPSSSQNQNLLQDYLNKFMTADDHSTLSTNSLTNNPGEAHIATVSREAVYKTTMKFYKTVDTKGGVKDSISGLTLYPGDIGYSEAAQTNIGSFGSYLGQNGKTLTVELNSPGERSHLSPIAFVNDPDRGEQIYFSFAAANSDLKQHFSITGDRKLLFEDMFNLGDADFNDMEIMFKLA